MGRILCMVRLRIFSDVFKYLLGNDLDSYLWKCGNDQSLVLVHKIHGNRWNMGLSEYVIVKYLQGFRYMTFSSHTKRTRPMSTLQETNISHLEKRKIIFKHTLGGNMLVPRRVLEETPAITQMCDSPHVHPFILIWHQYNIDYQNRSWMGSSLSSYLPWWSTVSPCFSITSNSDNLDIPPELPTAQGPIQLLGLPYHDILIPKTNQQTQKPRGNFIRSSLKDMDFTRMRPPYLAKKCCKGIVDTRNVKPSNADGPDGSHHLIISSGAIS